MSIQIIVVKILIFGLIALIASTGMILQSYAHTTVEVGPFEIEAGWGEEPPIVGIRNHFVLEVSEPGENPGLKTGIKNAFSNLSATAKFGGSTKILDVGSESIPGHYFANVIPTKTGSYSIILKGQIQDVVIDVEIPIEDVETTAVLDFPPTSSSSDQDVASLKNAISSLQKELSSIKSGTGIAVQSDGGAAYDFAIFGLSIASAAIILAIIALVKRK